MKSQQEFYEIFLTELQSSAPELTDTNEGSDIDIVAGLASLATSELAQIAQAEFRKTYFRTAHGPDITGGPDDLQDLAVDHFGEAFRRPGAKKSATIVTFARLNTDKGDVEVPLNLVVKTKKTSAGNSVSFKVISPVVMTGTTISASVEASVAGTSGNVNPNTILEIETALSDSSVTVTNVNAAVGGKAAENDEEYRLTIIRLLDTLKGATLRAIEAMVAQVPGVFFVKAIEVFQYVREWDVANGEPIGDYFGLPRPIVYVADVNGNASPLLLEAVKTAVTSVRAAGIKVTILAAIPVEFDWAAVLTLNPSGPNYSTLQTDLGMIRDEMRSFVKNLPVGWAFYRDVANNYILNKYGPAGSNDLATFSTAVPTADLASAPNQKLIVGTVTANGQ